MALVVPAMSGMTEDCGIMCRVRCCLAMHLLLKSPPGPDIIALPPAAGGPQARSSTTWLTCHMMCSTCRWSW